MPRKTPIAPRSFVPRKNFYSAKEYVPRKTPIMPKSLLPKSSLLMFKVHNAIGEEIKGPTKKMRGLII